MRARIHRFVPEARLGGPGDTHAHAAGAGDAHATGDTHAHAAGAGDAEARLGGPRNADARPAGPDHAPGCGEQSTHRGDLLLDRLVSALLEISLALALTLLPALGARLLGETAFLAAWLPLAGLGWILSRPAVWRWGGSIEAPDAPDAPLVLREFGASRS